MTGLKVISSEEEWKDILEANYFDDIYYQYEFAKSLELHGDGMPLLIYYQGKDVRLFYVVMKRDIAEDPHFQNDLNKGELFDMETPYGYGGPIVVGEFSEEEQESFKRELKQYCQEQGIVSQFVRFYPMLDNHNCSALFDENKHLKDTIYIDTSEEELIFKNMDSKNRNMVRKAIKNDVTIFQDKGERLDDFLRIYEHTMQMHEADEYYTFGRDYFEYLIEHMYENINFFYALYENQVISASMFLFNKEIMHYHLSGTEPEFRNLAAANLLLYEAAKWAAKEGIPRFHLGGGMSRGDSLFGFKKQFNKTGQLPFVIGKTVFMPERYEELLDIRVRNEEAFDRNNVFFIQYRK